MDDPYFGEHEYDPAHPHEAEDGHGTAAGERESDTHDGRSGDDGLVHDHAIGGSTETPASEILPRMNAKRRRRGLALVGVSAVAVAVMAILVARHPAPARSAAATPAVRGRLDHAATAHAPSSPAAGLDSVVDSARGQTAGAAHAAMADASDSSYLLGPTVGRARTRAPGEDDIAAAVAAGGTRSLGSSPAGPPRDSAARPATGTSSTVDTSQARRLARERLAYAAMQERGGRRADTPADSAAKARTQEEARLKGQPLRWAQNTDADRSALPAGHSASALLSADDTLAALAGFGLIDTGRGAGPSSLGRGAHIDVPPGTRVTAVTTSEFVSDASGAGIIEARLTEPLKVRDDEILPAGTRATGAASATPPAAGRSAAVSITFTAFETPSGATIKGGLTGKVIDPKTLALSVPGSVDRHLATQIVGDVASTGVELALSSGEQTPRNILEAPTVREQAIAQAGARAGQIIQGPLQQQSAFTMPTVRLAQGTAIVIAFGL